MAVINVQNWSCEQVVDWLTGLDPSLSQYAEVFTSHGVTGQRLLNLMPGDLEYILRIGRIGDQLLLHDAIQALRDELQTPWTTLQTLSLALSVRCKNYRSELTQQKQRYLEIQAKEAELAYAHAHAYNNLTQKSNVNKSSSGLLSSSSERGSSDRDRAGASSSAGQVSSSSIVRMETIPTTSLASASYLLDAGKVLIRWLTRFPFLGKLNYDEISRKLTKHCFELAVLSQRDTFADNAIEEVQYLCTKIIELCEALIHSNDSLAIQPAGIDIITLRKRNEQDWGLQFESSYWGLHQITGVKLSSPAQQSGHLERGDEILQVNYQTVLAWPQTSVISLLHENENEVILTVKRRPRHASTNLLLLGGHQNNMYLNKVPNRKSFFERKAKEERACRERNVCRQESSRVLLDEVLIEEQDETNEKERVVEKPEENDTDAKNNDAAIPSEDEKIAASDVRFWKLYPKPKYLIKRRATVTGASPTDTRPPVTFIHDTSDLESSTPGSSPRVPPQNHRSDPSESQSPAPSKAHQTVHHRRSTPVTTITSNETHTMQLLHPPLVPRPPLDKSRSAPEQDTVVEQNNKPQKTTDEPNQKEDIIDDDEVFEKTKESVIVVTTSTTSTPTPPTPKPRLSRSSTTTQPEAATPPPTPPRPAVPAKPEPQPRPILPPPPPTVLECKEPPKVLYRGILHIRSQLRKQSSSNSASALPVIGPNCSLSSSATSLMLCSSSPRWIRQNAVFYSNRELEIINPVSSNTRSVSVSNSSALSNQQNFRVKIALRDGSSNGVRRDEFTVYAASEVHSRPFAFKITSGDSVTYYLAAESQMELDQWISVMTTGEVINPPDPRLRSGSTRSTGGGGSGGLSSTGDSGRRNFARAPYKRSISLGSSQSPTVSYTNLSTPPHSSTPPPGVTQSKAPVTPRFYASSTNLSTCSLPPPSNYKPSPSHRISAYSSPQSYTPQQNHDSPTRSLLNRSKSSNLKTDWFLRNTTTTSSSSTPSSNISSITITSKKVTKSQVATQYPTPTGTPTKQSTSSGQPMMGVAMKTKKNSTSSSSTSPTRKYMCPNCCNVTKVDTGTQTDHSSDPPPHQNEMKSGELKLVFFNSGESRV